MQQTNVRVQEAMRAVQNMGASDSDEVEEEVVRGCSILIVWKCWFSNLISFFRFVGFDICLCVPYIQNVLFLMYG